MCTPDIITQAVTTAIGTISTAAQNITSQKQENINNQYRRQVAINNIKQANQKALELQQTGIEKSRSAKVEGLRQMAALKAQNSSNGCYSNSTTNLQTYNDTLTNSYAEANSILDEYNKSADSYFKKANSYLSEYNNNVQKYNQSQYSSAINSLGNMANVASSWYSKNLGDNDNEYI